MTLPFRENRISFRSRIWPDVEFRYEEDRIVIAHATATLHALSSAVLGGGFANARLIANWKVPVRYDCSDSAGDLRSKLKEWGCDPDAAIGLMTAARLDCAAIAEAAGESFSLLCCTTVGTGNAARAGAERPVFPAYSAGTINTVLLVDGRMTASAMVNAVITATEAKSAALQDLGIVDPLHGKIATGTTTDAIVVAVSGSDRYEAEHRYAGAATTIGGAIGKAVYESVREAANALNERTGND